VDNGWAFDKATSADETDDCVAEADDDELLIDVLIVIFDLFLLLFFFVSITGDGEVIDKGRLLVDEEDAIEELIGAENAKAETAPDEDTTVSEVVGSTICCCGRDGLNSPS